jgi:hypothetical protein
MASASDPFTGTSFGPRGKRPTSIEERVRLIEDHEDIARLMSLYCHYNDGGWEGQGPSHMGPSADLFVEDGVWDDCGPIGRAEGREKIRALFTSLRATPYVSHNVMNPLIDVNGDVARGHWHLIALAKWPNRWGTEDNDGHWSLAIYHVEFQRTSDGWRFTKMLIRRGREMPQRGYNAPPQWSVE